MERLTADDAHLLSIEGRDQNAHGLTIGVFEGPEPSFDDLLERVRDRIGLIPRYRQRLVNVPFGIARPVWADDPSFNLDFHVRHTALPERRSTDALPALVSRLLSQRLDRGKPLWELWMVSALHSGNWALISKVHYAVIDGVSGTDLFALLLDDIADDPAGGAFAPRPVPSAASLLPAAVVDGLLNPVEGIRGARDMVESTVRLGQRALETVAPSRRPSIGTVTGPHRRWQRMRVNLDDLRKIRDAHDCATADVVVAAITGGLRHYLLEQGEPVPRLLDTLVPLVVASEATGFSQTPTAVRAMLPIGTDDPALRLHTIAANSRLGAREGAVAGDALRRQDQFSTPTLMALGVRATMLEAGAHRNIDTVAINVPGPAETQSVLGKELLKAYPVVPLPARVRIAFAAMSYRDELSIGITGDFDTTPNLEILAEGIERSIAELVPAV